MCQKYPKGEISLWCDERADEDNDTGNQRKCKKEGETLTKRQGKEEEVDDIFRQLKERHREKFDI